MSLDPLLIDEARFPHEPSNHIIGSSGSALGECFLNSSELEAGSQHSEGRLASLRAPA